MRYNEIKKIISQIEQDIKELKEYLDVDSYISENYVSFSISGQIDDNTLQLSNRYKMLKQIEQDKNFMLNLKFVLSNYCGNNKL